jgi:hypothetical protein
MDHESYHDQQWKFGRKRARHAQADEVSRTFGPGEDGAPTTLFNFNSRQNRPFCRKLEKALPCLQGVQRLLTRGTFYKMGNGPKAAKPAPESDRKHLTGLEVEKLMDAAKESRNPERDRGFGCGCLSVATKPAAPKVFRLSPELLRSSKTLATHLTVMSSLKISTISAFPLPDAR